MDVALRLSVGIVLLVAGAAKLRAFRDLPDVLAAYGIRERLREPAAATLVAAELGLGALLVAGVAPRWPTLAAVALGVVFVVAVGRLRLAGVARLRCGCFGVRERSTDLVLARAVTFTALAGLATAAAWLGAPSLAAEAWLGLALAVVALAVAALGVLVLALYRQVGVLTLRLGPPQGALEIAGEGPELAQEAPPLAGLAGRGSELVAFLSPACRICRDLLPGIRALDREGLAVRVVDEGDESEAFRAWNVPGSPFVVHLVDGVVAAKGLVNTLEQLDGLVATGRARRLGAAA